MNGKADPSEPDESAATDPAFDQLLAQVARGPQSTLLAEGAAVGEYRIVKLLGRGAFGAVYHGAHVVIGKQVALKVLGAQFSEDATMSARFIDEARAVNRIAHPNIVDIFGFGVLPDGRKYCVMELLDGETLGARLERGSLPLKTAVEILSQVASALDAAHASSIVHRDLKPDNIFLCRTPTGEESMKVKLLDFGIAQVADSMHQRTGSNLVLGTPAYMSPEQCRGGRVDFRADIYALGAVSFEVLTGAQPFQGANAMQLVTQHVAAVPPAPSQLLPALGPQIDAAVLAMLAKQPEQRPPSASAAIRALSSSSLSSSSLSSSSSGAVPATPSSGDARRASRPALLALLGAVVVALALAALLAWAGKSERGPRAGAASAVVRAEPRSPVVTPSALTSVARASVAEPEALAAAPALVTLTVNGSPSSAKIFRGNEELGRVGQPFKLPRSEQSLSLSVRAPGFLRRELEVAPARDLVLEVKPLSSAGKKRNRDLEY